jgi:hypothetical protein
MSYMELLGMDVSVRCSDVPMDDFCEYVNYMTGNCTIFMKILYLHFL